MKRFLLMFSIVLLLIMLLSCIGAQADMAPKPTVTVRLFQLEHRCFATLLSEDERRASFHPYDGTDESIDEKTYYRYPEIWKKMAGYRDEDGFYFLQRIWNISYGEKTIVWDYYPPERFKLLLYFPESDTFEVSGILKRDAFYCYYYASLEGERLSEVSKREPYTGVNENRELTVGEAEASFIEGGLLFLPLISFLLTFLLTFATEYLIAAAFGFYRWRYLLCILITNFITLFILNLLLILWNAPVEGSVLCLPYLIAEICAVTEETLIYLWRFRHYGEKRVHPMRIVLYTVSANAVTYLMTVFIHPLGLFF